MIVAIVPIAAAVMARRNVKLGRGDRRGAFRTWAFAFGGGVVAYAIAPGHVPSLAEVDRMFATLGEMLFWSGVLFVVYLALEPYVRRTWPSALITWSRLTTGRLRDPLVGRDLVVGTIAGLILALLEPLTTLVPPALGYAGPPPYLTFFAPLNGVRAMLATITSAPLNALLNGMITMLMLSLIRQGMRALAGMLPGLLARAVGSQLAVTLVTIVLFVLVIKRNSLNMAYPWLDIGIAVFLVASLLLVAVRFGLFALIVTFLVLNFAGDAPLTLNPDKLYAGPVWVLMAVLAGFGVVGVWMARAGQPFFSEAAGVPTSSAARR
jgi:hypothetical protein